MHCKVNNIEFTRLKRLLDGSAGALWPDKRLSTERSRHISAFSCSIGEIAARVTSNKRMANWSPLGWCEPQRACGHQVTDRKVVA
jgi:hypothetical protein